MIRFFLGETVNKKAPRRGSLFFDIFLIRFFILYHAFMHFIVFVVVNCVGVERHVADAPQ